MKVYSVECDECGELCAYASRVMDDPTQPEIISLRCFIEQNNTYKE